MLRSEPDNNGNIASMYWAIFDGNPRLVVKTNVADDANTNYGKIVAPMDVITAMTIVDVLRNIRSRERDWKVKITIMSTWKNGEKLDKAEIINEVIIGKNADNEAYICLHEKGRPVFKFYFTPTQWHTLVKASGEAYTRSELTEIFAKSYAEALAGILLSNIGYGTYVSAYEDHEKLADGKPTFSNGSRPQQQNRGNWGNKGNWGNRNQGQNRGNWGNKGQNRNWGNRGGNFNNYNQGNRGNYDQEPQSQQDNWQEEDVPL